MSYAPYAPPQSPPESPYGTGLSVFRPLGWKTGATTIAIGASTVLSFLSGILGAVVGAPSAENIGAALVLLLVNLVVIGVSLAASVLFLMWIHHAATNVRAFGHQGLRFDPTWCVVWWFIPFASLWKPYQAFVEVWRASDPDKLGTNQPGAWLLGGAPKALPLWWALYIGASFVVLGAGIGQAVASMQGGSSTAANIVLGIGQLINGGAAAAIIWLVRRVDDNQTISAEKVSRTTAVAPAW